MAPRVRTLSPAWSATAAPARSAPDDPADLGAEGEEQHHQSKQRSADFTIYDAGNATMSQWFETLVPALIGLAGVLVGALITGGANYLIAIKSQQAEQKKTEQAQRVEVKVA